MRLPMRPRSVSQSSMQRLVPFLCPHLWTMSVDQGWRHCSDSFDLRSLSTKRFGVSPRLGSYGLNNETELSCCVVVLSKGNISSQTLRTLRSVLPTSTVWTALRPGSEFLSAEATLDVLKDFYPAGDGEGEEEDTIPEVVRNESGKPLVMSSLGGLISYV